MSILELGALGEFLGSFAVLATLVYLAVQVRHSRDLLEENRKIALSQVYAGRSSERLQDLRHAIDSPHVVPIRAKDLGQDEGQIRRRMVYQLMEVQVDTMLFQHRLGLLEPANLNAAENRIRENWDFWQRLGSLVQRAR